jgi:subtilisin family serine protease
MLSLCVIVTSSILAQEPALLGPSLADRKAATFLGEAVVGPAFKAQQETQHFDAGDFYLTRGGKRSLHRLAGAVAVQLVVSVSSSNVVVGLTGSGAPLAGYGIAAVPGRNLIILRTSPSEMEGPLQEAGRLQQIIERVRETAGIQMANPVFLDPESDLWLVAGQDIILRLAPDVDAGAYFGEDWSRVRPLNGTPDQFVLTLAGKTAEGLLAEVNRRLSDLRVRWAEPDFLGEIRKQSNDPLFPKQWHLHNTGLNGAVVGADAKVQEAWTITPGSSNIVVAVFDDGVQVDHPDLQANIFSNPGERAGNSVDDDQNGYVDDLHGWDFAQNDATPTPEAMEDFHGTCVAGIIGAVGNNGLGVSAVGYRCRIMPVRIYAGEFFVSLSTLAEAIYYAAGRTRNGLGTWRGADILNFSLSFSQATVVEDALSWAATNGRGGRGCPVFAAAGNNASHWEPSRMRLPVGLVLGPGRFRFGFEYRKDGSYYVGEDLVKIDNVALLGADGFSHRSSPLGLGGRQDFEGAFPPANWQLAADFLAEDWTVTSSGALQGTGGSRSACSGAIWDEEWTELQTPLLTLQGDEVLSFSLYVSSEADYDGLYVWVYDDLDDIVTVFDGGSDSPLASGNGSTSTSVSYPASHPSVAGVGASTDCDRRADYSRYGNGLDFLAPSSGGWNDLVTTDRTGSDGLTDGDFVLDFGGTSSSCPVAAGVAALVLSVCPALSATQVQEILKNTCDKIGGAAYDQQGWNTLYGHGRLNAYQAVRRFIPEILAVRIVGVDVQLTFTTLSNLTYRLERTDRLPPQPMRFEDLFSPWTVVPEAASVPGTGSPVQVQESGAVNSPHRFYRIRVES